MIHQNEVQAMHWCHEQVTIHPSCITYRCPVEGCNQLVLHEIVHISDDTNHDAHLVKKFQKSNIEILKKRGVVIRKLIEFTDQAPSQYKNKSAFRYMSQDDTPRQRNFFGVRHGKGPCDACAGRVKMRLTKLVKSEAVVINTAKSCFDAAKEFLETPWPKEDECAHYMLNFHFTNKIVKRPDTKKWKGVKDTRHGLHSIMNTVDHLKVNVRNIVCMCSSCLLGSGECRKENYVDSWRGFNMGDYKEAEPDFTLWKSPVIRKTLGSREDYAWNAVLEILASMNSFDELQGYISHNPLPFFDFHINNILHEADREHLDLVALHYLPDDAPDGFVPCSIVGDGNCFPRSLSFLCFRSQEMHIEMRVRLIYESVLNGNYYLSNRHLSRGCNIVYRQGGPVKQIAMYSTSYNPQQQLDVVEIYKKEVLEVSKHGSYCGLWQLAQAANILRRPVLSVYPSGLHEGMRFDFNRCFKCIDNKYNDREPVKIMWTPMQVSRNSYPVHFVPLLKAVGNNT